MQPAVSLFLLCSFPCPLSFFFSQGRRCSRQFFCSGSLAHFPGSRGSFFSFFFLFLLPATFRDRIYRVRVCALVYVCFFPFSFCSLAHFQGSRDIFCVCVHACVYQRPRARYDVSTTSTHTIPPPWYNHHNTTTTTTTYTSPSHICVCVYVCVYGIATTTTQGHCLHCLPHLHVLAHLVPLASSS